MQSTASTWFCTTCGAANNVGQTVCFSCNRARSGQSNVPPEDIESPLHGRYRLLNQVGVGGFGEVFKALDTKHADRVVAIKQINLRGLSPQKTIEATDTFNRELHVLSPLKHPNLPRIYDHFTDPDHWYLVMEFLEGETLERYLENRLRQRTYAGAGTPGLLPFEEIFALAFQLCDVLDYLHARQPPIIFRDLKPANIMRTGSGHICLIDFGIARLFTPGRTKDTTPLGSPGYAAPEQYGRAQTTARSDLYSLGALLHHLVTGDDPSETPFQFAPLPQLSPTTLAGTRELETLILRMVDADSRQRPASAREVKEELQRTAYLVAESAEPRIWSPPPGLPPDPEVEGALQQQVLLQIQKQVQTQKSSTRRKFLRRSLIGGGAVILGGGLIGTLFSNLFNDNGFGIYGPHPASFDGQGTGTYSGLENVSNIALSPDGRMVVFVAADHSAQNGDATSYSTVRVYQIDQGKLNITNPDSPGQEIQSINTLAWSPDNKRLAIGCADGTIIIWNTSSGTAEHTYMGTTGAVESIAWSPDGTLIAFNGMLEALRIYKVDGTVVSSDAGTSFSERSFLSWSPDSTRIVTPNGSQNAHSSPFTLQVWDVRSSNPLFTFGDLDMLQVAWSPDGNTIASLSVTGVLFLYDALNATIIKSYVIPNDPNVDIFRSVQLLWSLDSKYLALDNGEPDLYIWNIKNDHTRSIPLDFDSPRAVLWLPSGQISTIGALQNMMTINVSDL